MELFGFTDDIFEQQDCLCFSKIADSIKEKIERRKESFNDHYSTIKELAINRMAVLKQNLNKLTDGDTAHYSE